MNLSKRLRIEPGATVRLDAIDPGDRLGLAGKAAARATTTENVAVIDVLQERLYAEGKRALLVVLQALDAGGKDGTIRAVFSGVNPQGCRVTSFKQPTSEEAAHDFLWRVHPQVPRKGMIGIFNRSHYEDVLVVRVEKLAPRKVWSQRYEEINAFEKLLAGGGVEIIKFFLHISRDEQAARLRERLENPAKRWKFSPADLKERERWDDYVRAFEDCFSRCSTRHAPWYVIPADHNWVRNLAVSQIVRRKLEEMDPQLPEPDLDLSLYHVD